MAELGGVGRGKGVDTLEKGARIWNKLRIIAPPLAEGLDGGVALTIIQLTDGGWWLKVIKCVSGAIQLHPLLAIRKRPQNRVFFTRLISEAKFVTSIQFFCFSDKSDSFFDCSKSMEIKSLCRRRFPRQHPSLREIVSISFLPGPHTMFDSNKWCFTGSIGLSTRYN